MRYLLGTLSNEERERFEERYFSDDAEFEEIEIVEDELIDRYIRGELAASDAVQFRQTLANSPRLRERVEFAKLFADKLRTAESPIVAPSWRERLFGFTGAGRAPQLALAFSTVLVLVAGTIVVVGWLQLRRQSQQLAAQQTALDQRQRELEKQAADLKAQIDQFARLGHPTPTETPLPQISPEPSPQAGAAVVFLTLAPGATRSASGLSQLRILPGTSEVQLTLNLRGAIDYSSYSVTINSIDHGSVFSKSDLKPRATKLTLRVPAQRLPPNDYNLTLYGEPGNDPVDDYPFRVIR